MEKGGGASEGRRVCGSNPMAPRRRGELKSYGGAAAEKRLIRSIWRRPTVEQQRNRRRGRWSGRIWQPRRRPAGVGQNRGGDMEAKAELGMVVAPAKAPTG